MIRKAIKKDGKTFLECTRCGAVKEATTEFFGKKKDGVLGLSPMCKPCIREYYKKRFIENREEILKKTNEYYHSHKEYYSSYYQKNKEKRLEYARKYREENLDKITEYKKKNREKRSEKNIEEGVYKEQWKKYYSTHREQYLESRKESKKEKHLGPIHLRTYKAIKKLGIRPKKCPICGREGKIEAHHPDYSKWYEIIFCCNSCHQRIHHDWFDCPANIVRLI